MTNIPDGHGLIPGRGAENARKVIAAAKAAGLDASVVKTTQDGYLAPDAVLAAYEAAENPPKADPKAEPKAPATKPAPKKPAAKKPATTTKKES